MPDEHGYCRFDSRSEDEIDDQWIEDKCHGCTFNFNTYDATDPVDLEDIADHEGNPAILIRYESRCPYGRGEGFHCVSFPCPAGYDGPSELNDDQYNGHFPPMAYSVDLVPGNGVIFRSYAWMQAVHEPDDLGRSLTRSYRTVNAFDDHAVCWGEDNSTPESLPAVVATYIDANANADLLPPSEFDMYRTAVRRDRPTSKPAGVVIGPGYDAALLVSARHHRSAYLLLRGSGIQAIDGVIAAGLRHHVVQHDDPSGSQTKGFATDPDVNGRFWFFSLDPLGNPDGSQALLLAQFSACTSTPPSSSALAAPAAS